MKNFQHPTKKVTTKRCRISREHENFQLRNSNFRYRQMRNDTKNTLKNKKKTSDAICSCEFNKNIFHFIHESWEFCERIRYATESSPFAIANFAKKEKQWVYIVIYIYTRNTWEMWEIGKVSVCRFSDSGKAHVVRYHDPVGRKGSIAFSGH